MESFNIQYLGGIGRVTGSCTLVEKNGVKFLVDCGMVQGEAHEDFENTRKFPFDPAEIKFIILTHAHLDHCGLIPRLSEEGFHGKIYCSTATRKLAIEILRDAAWISKLYKENSISSLAFECIDQRDNFKWGHLVPIDNDLMIALYRSAHILGSCSVVIADMVRRDSIWFSGDVGRNSRDYMSQPLLKYRQQPDIRNSLVVCESTYGANPKPSEIVSFEDRQSYFENIFKETLIGKQGDVIIPAFSLQRTQDILTDLFLLFKNQPDLCEGITVICDSPLARRISRIYSELLFEYNTDVLGSRNYKYLNPELISKIPGDSEASLKQLSEVFSADTTLIGQHRFKWCKKRIDKRKPAVYISSAGMCSAGPVVGHLKRVLSEKRNTVVLTGYQAKGTVGSKLLNIKNGVAADEKPFFKGHHLTPKMVKADIESISYYSGHADKEGLLTYLFNAERGHVPREIHLNHGDDAARISLKNEIIERYEYLNSQNPGTWKKPRVRKPRMNSVFTIKNGKVKKVKTEPNSKNIKSVISGLVERLAVLEKSINSDDSLLKNLPSVDTNINSNVLSDETQSLSSADDSKEKCIVKSNTQAKDSKLLSCQDKRSDAVEFVSTPCGNTFNTDDKELNDICDRHPAISQARMSEANAVGFYVNYGNYVIYVMDDFEFPTPNTYNKFDYGWVETATALEMRNLIGKIEVRSVKVTSFGTFNGPNLEGPCETTRKPKKTDKELNISRNPDGSIALRSNYRPEGNNVL